MTSDTPLDPPESRWPAVVAVLAVGGIYLALPASLAVGPRWLQLVIVLILVVPTVITHRRGNHALNQILGLPSRASPHCSWSGHWCCSSWPFPPIKNLPRPCCVRRLPCGSPMCWFRLLVLASGRRRPQGRDLRIGHPTGAFLFPQMTLEDKGERDGLAWSPNFVDYLFLAFNTSTAFSPTDTPILSRWAKVLTMLQCTISLTVVIVLAARAVNIL